MKKDNWDDIEVNERKHDRVVFESNRIQSAYNKIDSLRDGSKGRLRGLGSTGLRQQLDGIDIEELRENASNRIDDIIDNVSRFKDNMVDADDLPDEIVEQYRNTQAYFNRDDDYLRRAKRKLARLEAGELKDKYDTYLRVIELCDKSISVRSDNFEAYVLKAQTLVKFGRYGDAIESYIGALAIKDDVDIWMAIADANRLNHDFNDAIDVYDSILEKYGKTFEVLKAKAVVYYDLKDYAECDKLLKKANDIARLDEESFEIWSDSLEHLSNN